jgi:hypothetical protein
MSRQIGKWVIISVLAASLLRIAGFSVSEMSWKSNRDYKIAALNVIFERHLSGDYSSSADYLTKNPTCCNVYRYTGENSASILWALTFGFRAYVQIKYPIKDGVFSGIYMGEYFVESSGKVHPVRGIEL